MHHYQKDLQLVVLKRLVVTIRYGKEIIDSANTSSTVQIDDSRTGQIDPHPESALSDGGAEPLCQVRNSRLFCFPTPAFGIARGATPFGAFPQEASWPERGSSRLLRETTSAAYGVGRASVAEGDAERCHP